MPSITIRGMDFPYSVTDEGMFTASVRDTRLEMNTREGLKAEIERKLKRDGVKVSIPFTHVVSPGAAFRYGAEAIQDGFVTGMNVRSRKFLIRWANGSAGTSDTYGSNEYLRPMSDDEKDAYAKLLKSQYIVDQAVREFVAQRSLGSMARLLEDETRKALAVDGAQERV
jgi:hypothetical protein